MMWRWVGLGAIACGGGGAEPTLEECGDGEVSADEACDDGNLLGGDGCAPDCTIEEGPLETEPNDTPADAQPLDGTITGGLAAGDRDCYAVDVPEAGAVRAGIGGGGCDADVVLTLFDATEARIATGFPTPSEPCAAIDPDLDTFARYLPAGRYTVCVEAAFEADVPAYTLTVQTPGSCDELGPLTPHPSQDRDADEIADVCDPDDDDDGVVDADDNCPLLPNGPETPFGFDTSDEGRVRLWSILGPFAATQAAEGCEPGSEAADLDLGPALGDDGPGNRVWFAHLTWPEESATVNFNTWFQDEPAPREAYAATWVRSPDTRDAVISMGADDGFRVFLNGTEVGLHTGCQGVYPDAYAYPVTLSEGWNRLVVRVYDGGGGWAVVTRITDDAGAPMTDLDVSLGGAAPWLDDQSDSDGDGIGDICDPTP